MSFTSSKSRVMSRKHLPLEIIETILHLLPAKSLGRFKSVSKTWNSLISDSQFIKNHVRHTRKQQTKLILFCDKDSLYSISTDEFRPYLKSDDNDNDMLFSTSKEISFGSPPKRCLKEIFGSCNGLVLAGDTDCFNMFVTNPTTRELWKLPLNPFLTAFRLEHGTYPCRYGFGYDSSTDDYKIVTIWPQRSFPHVSSDNVSIYSLRNNSWRELPNAPHDHPSFGGALVNHNYHWLAGSSIIAFSFVDEVFTEIKLSGSCRYKSPEFYNGLVDIGGRLGVFRGGLGGCELWVMQEYGDANSYTKVYSHEDCMWPVCLVEGSDRNIVLNGNDELQVFNIDEGRCRNVRIVVGPSQFAIEGTFVESIESLKRINTTP